MNDQQLDRNLRSIGKECFVTFFEKFCNSKLPDEAVARHIAGEWGCDYTAALGLRVRPARRIIAAGRGNDALAVCAKARVPRSIKDRATALATGKT